MGIRVITTRRNPDPGSKALPFDSANNLVPPASAFKGVTHLLSTIPPGRETSDPVLRTLGPLLQQQPLRWVGYLSTTGVYGDTGGQWVRETDPPKATQERSSDAWPANRNG